MKDLLQLRYFCFDSKCKSVRYSGAWTDLLSMPSLEFAQLGIAKYFHQELEGNGAPQKYWQLEMW